MKKLLLSGLLGMIVYFLWGFLAWTVLPLHQNTIRPLPSGLNDAVSSIAERGLATGAYFYPQQPENMENEEAMSQYTTRHNDGPLLTLLYRAEGVPIMHWSLFVKALVLYFIISFLLAFLLRMVVEYLESLPQRMLFVAVLGLLGALSTYLDHWVWFYYPLGYSVMMSVDLVIRWLLLGLVIGLIIKPERKYKVGNI